jgi:hypothetical protein
VSWRLGEPPRPEETAELQRDLNARLRDDTHVGAFAVERQGEPHDATFLRGFVRACNWAQYGGNHTGACLVYDGVEFESATADFARDSGGVPRFGRVEYEDNQATVLSDGQFIRLPWWLPDPAVRAERVASEHWQALLFSEEV